MAKFKYASYPGYGYKVNEGTIAFSLSPNPKKFDRALTVPWATCRDYINDAIINEMNGQTFWNHKEDAPPFDMDRLRLIVAAKEESKPYIFTAKKILNVYEKAAGFKGRSMITTIEVENAGDDIGTWLITGPKEWMKCTQLVSMCTLIIRICNTIKADRKSFKDLAEVEEMWANAKPGGRNYNGDLTNKLPRCWPRWRVLMENFDKIFKGLGNEDLFPADKTNGWHGPGGIYSLCSFGTGIEELDKRFKDACVKAGVCT